MGYASFNSLGEAMMRSWSSAGVLLMGIPGCMENIALIGRMSFSEAASRLSGFAFSLYF